MCCRHSGVSHLGLLPLFLSLSLSLPALVLSSPHRLFVSSSVMLSFGIRGRPSLFSQWSARSTGCLEALVSMSQGLRTSSKVAGVDMCLFSDSLCTHISMSYCSDLGPDCTRSFTARAFAFARAGKHIKHLRSLALDVLPVPDCVWNHLVSLQD